MSNPHFRREPFTDHVAYIWSLEQAAFAPHEQQFNGTPYAVERGEFVTSYAALTKQFGWETKRVRGFVNRMIKAGLWAKRRAYNSPTAPSVICICNYDEMQSLGAYSRAVGGKGTGKAKAKPGQRKGKEHKEGKNKSGMNVEKEADGAALRWSEEEAEIITAWNGNAETCRWRKVGSLSAEQREKLHQRLDEVGLQGMRAAIIMAGGSPYLGGPQPPRWFTFDTLLDHDKLQKLIRGEYDELYARVAEYGG